MLEKQEWRLLLVDDDEDDYLLTRSMLSQSQGRKVKLDWAPTYEAGYRLLFTNNYDAVLVDYDLGPRNGIGLIREIVSQEYPAPLILYTGRGSYEVDVEAMQAGATLYITKTEATPLLLERSIRYAIERKQIETELQASNERLAQELSERQRVEQMLGTAHTEVVNERNRLLAVMESLPVGVAIVDAQGGNMLSNRSFEQIWGGPRPETHTVSDYAAYKAWWMDTGQPVQPEEWASARAVQKGETVVGQLIEIERFDGAHAFILNSAAPIFDAQGQIASSAVAILDITGRMQAEKDLRGLNRTLRALSNSNQALMRTTEESTLLQEVCKIVVEDCGHAMVWIGYAEEDEGKQVRPVAYAGFEEGYLETLKITWADTERGRGPTGTAIRNGQPCICRNMLTDPAFLPWREQALRRGYASSIALPLNSGGKTFGALMIYSREPDPFSKEEVKLLTELANDLAHGILSLRWRAAKARAEEELRVTLTSIGDGVITTDQQGVITFLNPVAEKLTGWTIKEASGQPLGNVFKIIDEQTGRPTENPVGNLLRDGVALRLENHPALLARDGRVIPIDDSAAPIKDGANQTLGAVIVFQDVSEKVKAEQELLRAEQEWERTFDSMPDLIAILDDHYRIVRANHSMAQRLGVTPEKCIGMRCFECVHATAQPLPSCPHTQTLRDGQEHVAEVHEAHLGGDFLVSTTPLLDKQGQVTGSVHVARDITARKQAEQALRASEERLSLAIEGAGMATWDVDLRTGRAVWSRRHFELLGYAPNPGDQATLDMWLSRVHPEDLDRVLAAFDSAQRERSLYCPHHRVLRADNGQVVWLRVFGRFFYDEAGQPARFLGVLFDDTPFQQAARFIDARALAGDRPAPPSQAGDLRQSGIEVIGAVPWGTHFCQFYTTSQDLVETLVPYFRAGLAANEFCMWVTSDPLQVEQAMAALRSAAPDLDEALARGQIEILDYSQWYTPAGRFDADAVLQGWKDKLAAARQRGFAGLRLTGNTFWLEQAHWDDFTRYEEKVNQVIGGQRMLALCTYSLEKCGVREIMDVVANHQFALIKRAGRWEIIESARHMKTEQALRESEERLRLAVWAAELGVFEWDVSSERAVWENQRMYAIFGRSEAEGPIGNAQLMQAVIHPEDAASFEAALAEGMQPGRLFHAICRIRRCNDGELRWIEFSGRYERDADGKPLQLNGVAGDITDRKQLEESMKRSADKLARSNQALEDFAFIASHDLQEPLRKVQAFGDRLKSHYSQGLGEEGQDYIERMQGAVGRMQSMLNGLLAYSRVNTQGQPFAPVDLQKIATEVLSDLEVRIMQTGGQVEVGKLPVIEADPLQMRQLLQNLIGNALKFHCPGSPPYVRVTCQPESENRIVLAVEDHGIGFEMAYADQLFKPFHRLHSISAYEGTGMGLAICKKIVERHAGAISAQSSPGQGSTFTVTIPIQQAG